MIEFLNKVELIGTVGTTRVTDCGETRCINLSLVTEYFYTAKDGTAVVEMTWHHVVCYEGKGVCPLSEITKGAHLHILGRLRQRRYTSESGEERIVEEIVANSVEPASGERT